MSNTKTDIKNIFFDKNNIIFIKNQLMVKKGLANNMCKEDKKEIVSIIIENMKIIFRNIDIEKINDTNRDYIFSQFNNHVLEESFKDINKIVKYNSKPNPLNIRDFSMRDKPNTNMLDRPLPTKIHCPAGNNELMNQQLDIKDIQNKRDSIYTNRPPAEVPDILKPKSTSIRKDNDIEVNNQQHYLQNNHQQTTSGHQQAMMGGSAIFNIKDFSKPLIPENVVIEENNLSFEENLKILKRNREIAY